MTKTNKPINVVQVPLSKITLPTVDMRSSVNGDNVQDLVDSIRAIGLISPILIKKTKEGFEVVAGARRFRAVTQLDWQKIPAIVYPAAGIAAELAKMHENQIRHEVSPIDEAEFLQSLVDAYKLTGKDLAKKINRAESYVSERLALLKAPEELKEAVQNGALSFSSARELSRIKDPAVRDTYISHAVQSGINDTTARQWRMDANRATRDGAEAPQPGESGKVDSVQRIKVQCALTGKTIAIERTILIRVETAAWEELKEEMLAV